MASLLLNFLSMKSFNRVMLIGNLTADPELRSTTTGKTVAYFTLAVNHRSSKDPEGGVDFHRIVAWNKMADFSSKYLKKGMAVFLVGRLANHSFEGKNGKQWVTEILLQDLNILTWRGRETSVEETPVVEEVDVATGEISATMFA